MSDVTEIWQDILDAVREVGPRPSRLDEFLVNGALLVTLRQFLELKRAAVESDNWPRKPDPGSIPVVVVGPHPTEVGGGKMAFVGPDGMIYVFDKAALTPTWEHPPLRLLPDARYPLL